MRERQRHTLWRIHIRPKGPDGKAAPRKSIDLCLGKGVIGIGWGFQGEKPPTSVKEFYRRAKKKFSGKGWQGAANAIISPDGKGMEIGDLVWMRNLEGTYYLGRITGGWEYNHSGEFGEHDIVNMRPCDLHRVDKRIPGAIINRFVSSQTVCRIHDKTALIFSKLVYNDMTESELYDDTDVDLSNIFSLLSAEDLEDVVGLYLQHERGYMLIPSSRTRRNDAIKYEYELVHRKTGKRAFVQVKSGELLNPINYNDNDGKYYLFCSKGYIGEESSVKVETLKRNEVEDFLYREKDKMPYHIRMWIEYRVGKSNKIRNRKLEKRDEI